jgi:hypothetical protein
MGSTSAMLYSKGSSAARSLKTAASFANDKVKKSVVILNTTTNQINIHPKSTTYKKMNPLYKAKPSNEIKKIPQIISYTKFKKGIKPSCDHDQIFKSQ